MMDKFTASAKLYLLIFIMVTSLIGLGLYSINYLKKMSQNTQTLYVDRVLAIQQLSDVRFAYAVDVVPVAQEVKNHLLSFGEGKKQIQQSEEIINSNWHNYKQSYLTPEELILVKQTDLLKKRADETSNHLKAILSREDVTALNQFIEHESLAPPNTFYKKLTELMELQVRVSRDIFNNNNEIYHTTSKKFFLLILVSLGIALSLSFLIIKSIKKLIANISKSSNIIKESEERYRSLFEQASDAIYVLNFKGYFISVNDSMCQLVGYTRDELLTMNVADLVSAELLKINPLIYTVVKPGQSITGERKVIHKNGVVIDIEINGKKFADDRVIVIARDITARKEMEAELRNAELKFRTLADKSMVGIYIVQKGKFVYVNPRFAEVFGYEPDELIGKPPVEAIIHPDYQDVSKENIRIRIDGELEGVHYEAKGKRKDGSSNWVEFYGSRAIFEDEPTIIGSMIDITERKVAEEELKASEQKYKLLFESSPVPLWIVAKDDLTVITANNAAAKLYGYTQAELLHMDIRKVRPVENWDKLLSSYKKDITDATDFGVIDHLKKDGTPIFVNIIAQDIIFEGKRARLSSTNDVTEKLKAEELLKKTEANLQTILNTTDTAYALLDHNLNVLEYNNKALFFAKHEFNFDPKNGGKLFDKLPQNRQLQLFEHISDVLKGNTISYEVSYPQPNETDIWYHIRMFPISNKDKEILGLVLGITDITERKDAEQSLQTAYESIKAHVTFIKEMMWHQSHILRSPLANLKGLIAILQNDPADKEVLEYIGIELDRMDKVFIETVKDSTKDEMNIYNG